MIRFALIAASTLGFFLTAALGNLMVPLLRAFQGRWDEPKARQAPSPKQEAPDAEPERPPQAPTMGGLCLMVGVLAAVGVGWTAACVAQPELLGAESLFSVRLLTALLGALLFGGVGLLEDLARIRSRSVLGLRRHTRLGLEAAAGAVVLVLLGAKGCLAAGITLPGVGYVDLGIAAPLLWEGLLVALAECARIADGMDGIVCGTSFAAMLGLMGVMTLLGWFPLGVLPAALAGALMAFLLWNFPPAKLRLGSVGSLFLAGMLGCVPLYKRSVPRSGPAAPGSSPPCRWPCPSGWRAAWWPCRSWSARPAGAAGSCSARHRSTAGWSCGARARNRSFIPFVSLPCWAWR